MLRSRYYLGLVTWRGVEHAGKHEPLVNAETFEQVQRVLEAHRLAGERSYKHKHYLSGSLFCARCDARLLYGITTGRQGDRYAYFFCAGRHSGRSSCQLPWLPAEQVEVAVERQWACESFPAEIVTILGQDLRSDLAGFTASVESERTRLQERIAAVQRERYKWADKAMEGVVPKGLSAFLCKGRPW